MDGVVEPDSSKMSSRIRSKGLLERLDGSPFDQKGDKKEEFPMSTRETPTEAARPPGENRDEDEVPRDFFGTTSAEFGQVSPSGKVEKTPKQFEEQIRKERKQTSMESLPKGKPTLQKPSDEIIESLPQGAGRPPSRPTEPPTQSTLTTPTSTFFRQQRVERELAEREAQRAAVKGAVEAGAKASATAKLMVDELRKDLEKDLEGIRPEEGAVKAPELVWEVEYEIGKGKNARTIKKRIRASNFEQDLTQLRFELTQAYLNGLSPKIKNLKEKIREIVETTEAGRQLVRQEIEKEEQEDLADKVGGTELVTGELAKKATEVGERISAFGDVAEEKIRRIFSRIPSQYEDRDVDESLISKAATVEQVVGRFTAGVVAGAPRLAGGLITAAGTVPAGLELAFREPEVFGDLAEVAVPATAAGLVTRAVEKPFVFAGELASPFVVSRLAGSGTRALASRFGPEPEVTVRFTSTKPGVVFTEATEGGVQVAAESYLGGFAEAKTPLGKQVFPVRARVRTGALLEEARITRPPGAAPGGFAPTGVAGTGTTEVTGLVTAPDEIAYFTEARPFEIFTSGETAQIESTLPVTLRAELQDITLGGPGGAEVSVAVKGMTVQTPTEGILIQVSESIATPTEAQTIVTKADALVFPQTGVPEALSAGELPGRPVMAGELGQVRPTGLAGTRFEGSQALTVTDVETQGVTASISESQKTAAGKAISETAQKLKSAQDVEFAGAFVESAAVKGGVTGLGLELELVSSPTAEGLVTPTGQISSPELPILDERRVEFEGLAPTLASDVSGGQVTREKTSTNLVPDERVREKSLQDFLRDQVPSLEMKPVTRMDVSRKTQLRQETSVSQIQNQKQTQKQRQTALQQLVSDVSTPLDFAPRPSRPSRRPPAGRRKKRRRDPLDFPGLEVGTRVEPDPLSKLITEARTFRPAKKIEVTPRVRKAAIAARRRGSPRFPTLQIRKRPEEFGELGSLPIALEELGVKSRKGRKNLDLLPDKKKKEVELI